MDAEGKKEEDVPLVEFMYLVCTRMPGESYRRQLGFLLLYLCYVFRALINSLDLDTEGLNAALSVESNIMWVGTMLLTPEFLTP